MTNEKRPERRMQWWGWAVVAAVVAAVIAIPVVLAVTMSQPNATAAAGTDSATPTPSAASGTSTSPAVTPDAPASASAEPSTDPDADAERPIAPEQIPVAPDEPATGGDGVVISLAGVEAVQGEGGLPGEVAGPAVRLRIAITNGAPAPLDLSGVAVNAYRGADRLPFSPLSEPGGSAFTGTLAPGETAEGVYLFSIPEADRGDVVIAVDYAAGQATIVFQGSIG